MTNEERLNSLILRARRLGLWIEFQVNPGLFVPWCVNIYSGAGDYCDRCHRGGGLWTLKKKP